MKTIVAFVVLFFLGTVIVSESNRTEPLEVEVAKVHVLHINAKWNKNND